MKNMILVQTRVAVILSLLFLPASAGAQNTSREALIEKKMDCVARHISEKNLSWENVCATSDAPSSDTSAAELPNPKSIAVNLDEKGNVTVGDMDAGTATIAAPQPAVEEAQVPVVMDDTLAELAADGAMDKKYSGEEKEPSPRSGIGQALLSRDNPLTKFEMATEYVIYTYEEPNFMKLSGSMYGVSAAYTYRTGENRPVNSLQEVFSHQNGLNMFRLESNFYYGELDYESNGSGSDSGVPNYSWSVQGTAGYDIAWSESLRITPYAGVGYRYLLDDAGGTTTDLGYWGYDRESSYSYLPIGIEATQTLAEGWSLTARGEYDYFISGKQKSHLEDGPGGLDTLNNRQDSGYGLRGSLKLMREAQAMDMFVEPFVRFWHIDDSNVTIMTSGGVPVTDPGGHIYGGMEPANETTEYGVRLGVRY